MFTQNEMGVQTKNADWLSYKTHSLDVSYLVHLKANLLLVHLLYLKTLRMKWGQK